MNEQTSPQTSAPVSLPPLGRRRLWLTLLLTLIVFASGLAVGSGLTFLYVEYRRGYYLAHPEEARNRFTARLKRTLHLTDEQARKVQAIFDDRWPKFQETRRQMYPAFKEHLDALHVQVAAVLREDQRAGWDEYIETIRRLWNPPPPTSTPTTAPSPGAASAPSPGP
jgi:hypothetical protein